MRNDFPSKVSAYRQMSGDVSRLLNVIFSARPCSASLTPSLVSNYESYSRLICQPAATAFNTLSFRMPGCLVPFCQRTRRQLHQAQTLVSATSFSPEPPLHKPRSSDRGEQHPAHPGALAPSRRLRPPPFQLTLLLTQRGQPWNPRNRLPPHNLPQSGQTAYTVSVLPLAFGHFTTAGYQ